MKASPAASVPAPSPRAGEPRSFDWQAARRQVAAVALHEMRRLMTARHGLARLLVLLLPFVLALIVALVRIAFSEAGPAGTRVLFGHPFTIQEDLTALAKTFRLANLRWVIFLSCAGLFGGLFSGERSERTLHHVFLQPVRREILTIGKFAGGLALFWIAAVAAWLLTVVTWLLPHGLGTALGTLFSVQGLGDFAAHAFILLLATLAYGGIFLLAGVLGRSPPIIALALLAWEGLCSFLPLAFQRFTVYYWLDSLLPLRVPAGPVLAVLAEPAPWPASLAACFLIASAAIGVAAWRARWMQVAYGASD